MFMSVFANGKKRLPLSVSRIAAMALSVSFVAQAENAVWTGNGDLSRPFTDSANWKDAYIPVAGDNILIKSKTKVLEIRDGDAAFFSTINGIYWQSAGDVIWNVSTNSTVPTKFGYWGGSTTNECFIKRGNADLRFTTDLSGSPSYLNANFVVEAGSVHFPDYRGGTIPRTNVNMGRLLAISNGATVATFTADETLKLTVSRIVCRGILTNENTSVDMDLNLGALGMTSELYSAIHGKIYLRPTYGTVNLYCTGNTISGFRPNGGRIVAEQQVVGLAKFGNTTGDSSIGTQELNYDFNGPVFRYLGNGETSDKTIRVKLHNEYQTWAVVHPVTIDGGENGGLTLTGSIYTPNTDPKILHIRLAGDHTNACTMDANVCIYADGGNHYCPLHFEKTDSWAWRFPDNAMRTLWGTSVRMIGGMSIEEGVVATESITDVGHPSAIGACSDCFGSYYGPYDAEKREPWAISLGAVGADGVSLKEGTLEHYGDETGYSSRAKFALAGNGRILSTGAGNLKLSHISAISAGEKKLTLDGDHAGTNVFCEISDGDGVVNVVKKGGGYWQLGGNQTFSGDLKVKAGTLEVVAPTNHFTWFRLTFLEIPSCDGYVMPTKIAFFDANGNHVSNGTVVPDEFGGYSGYPVADRVVTREFLDLPEPTGDKGGYFLPGSPGTYKWKSNNQCCSYCWFRDSVVNITDCSPYCSRPWGLGPNLDQEYTWFPIVIRLKPTVAKVAYYDIASGRNAARNPTALMLEGSRDGFNWTQLDRRTGLTVPDVGKWYSDGTDWAAGKRTVGNGAGYPVETDAAVSSFANVRSVSVENNATLLTTYKNIGPIRRLTFDAATGGGTIDGFEFAAANGVLAVNGLGRRQDALIPLTVRNSESYGNVRSWQLFVNGDEARFHAFSVSDAGIRVVPRGIVISFR